MKLLLIAFCMLVLATSGKSQTRQEPNHHEVEPIDTILVEKHHHHYPDLYPEYPNPRLQHRPCHCEIEREPGDLRVHRRPLEDCILYYREPREARRLLEDCTRHIREPICTWERKYLPKHEYNDL